MKYKNPIILADYSDPDCIRVNDDFFLIASSFNHTPGIPILHSKDLVNFELINYVYDNIPFTRFDNVIHGSGAWAPSIRYHNGTYYAIIPFPDEGIYVSSTNNPFSKWSPLTCLISGSGLEDPCPIWINDKCYLVVGFVKSRIGFNSVLAVYEVSTDLKRKISDYKIVYDGHNDNPTIEGPKFYQRNGYIYILAPAGGVKTGWQTALRSRNVYGPYESKIILTQSGTDINGPHQGALIDIDDNNFAFIHFQDLGCYGRVLHLQPVTWYNDWPICGEAKDLLLSGSPVYEHDYFLPKCDYKIDSNDDFNQLSLKLIWQTPANKKENWYKIENGLILYAYYHNEYIKKELNLCPNIFMQKICFLDFYVETEADLSHLTNNDLCGICLMGKKYAYLKVEIKDSKKYISICTGEFEKKDREINKIEYNSSVIKFNIIFKYPNKYKIGYNGNFYNKWFVAEPGRWVGSKIGIFAIGEENSKGYAKFNYFKNERI